jgi:hypothetical protein
LVSLIHQNFHTMQRAKGKVPTKINKDRVATGPVKTQSQIRTEGAVTPKTTVTIINQIRGRGYQERNPLDMQIAAAKKELHMPKEKIQPQHKQFTKRVEHGRNRN